MLGAVTEWVGPVQEIKRGLDDNQEQLVKRIPDVGVQLMVTLLERGIGVVVTRTFPGSIEERIAANEHEVVAVGEGARPGAVLLEDRVRIVVVGTHTGRTE